MNIQKTNNPATNTIKGGANTDLRHDSAIKHVTGRAEYCDDIAEPAGTLHAYLGLSTKAHAVLRDMDLSAVRAAPGVIDVLTASDLPGVGDRRTVGGHDHALGAANNWGFDEFSVEQCHIAFGGAVSLHDAACVNDLIFGGREGRVDTLDLRRVDGASGVDAEGFGFPGCRFAVVQISHIDMRRVKELHAVHGGAHDELGPRK